MRGLVRACARLGLGFGLALGLIVGPSFGAARIEGKVVGVVDGDTVDVLTKDQGLVRVRLTEIDAPEKNQPWGNRSKQMLSAMVFGQNVSVTNEGTDRFGRALGRMYVGGTDINAEMVQRGGAWVFRKYGHDRALLRREQAARSSRTGLWSEPAKETIPPWEWRHAPASNAASPAAPIASSVAGRTCGTKRLCREMTSCVEAKFYLKQCGVGSLDGDHDGVPCESVCNP